MKRVLFFVLLAGCATASPRHEPREVEPEDPRRALEEARGELSRDEQALAGTKAEGRPVDCPRAGQLADNICTLSERICALVERLPRTPENAAQCTDARARCGAARARVRTSCPGK